MREYARRSDPTRQPPTRRPVPTCVGRDGVYRTAARGRHSEKHLPFLELHRVKNTARYHQTLQEFLKHTLVADTPLVADAEVDEALVAYFIEKYRLGYSSSAGDILLGAMCHYFPEIGKHGGHFLPRSHRAPPGLEAPHPAQEQGSSRVVHMGSVDPGIPATWASTCCGW